jgi:hypothetical protein
MLNHIGVNLAFFDCLQAFRLAVDADHFDLAGFASFSMAATAPNAVGSLTAKIPFKS